MRNLICLVGFALAVAASPLQAGSLVLKYEGVLDYGSFDEFDNDLEGLSFEVNAVFDSTPIDSEAGTGLYAVTQLYATVAGVTYVEVDPGYFDIELYGPLTVDPVDSEYLVVLLGDYAFAPIFETATPLFTGDAAGPTVFSNYLGSFDYELEILTNSGFVNLVYDDFEGVSASISAIPEPSTAMLALVGGVGCSLAARRRKLSSAA